MHRVGDHVMPVRSCSSAFARQPPGCNGQRQLRNSRPSSFTYFNTLRFVKVCGSRGLEASPQRHRRATRGNWRFTRRCNVSHDYGLNSDASDYWHRACSCSDCRIIPRRAGRHISHIGHQSWKRLNIFRHCHGRAQGRHVFSPLDNSRQPPNWGRYWEGRLSRCFIRIRGFDRYRSLSSGSKRWVEGHLGADRQRSPGN
jgi:hypothetical protein